MSQPRGTGRLGQSGSGQYGVINKKSNTGAKLGTAFVLTLVFGGGGYAYLFYNDVPGQVRHLEAQDAQAVPAALAQWKRGVDPPAVGALRKGLATGRVALKRACAKALGAAKDHENTAFLGAAVLEDADAVVRAAAIEGIGVSGDINCSRYMSVALEDTSYDVKIAAVEAVGALKLNDHVPKLITFLKQSNSNLKTAAQRALESFLEPGRSFGDDQEEWTRWYEGEIE